MEKFKIGDQAPDFEGYNYDGKRISLDIFKGKKNVVIFFYPKNETSVCTKEACSFSNEAISFSNKDTEIIGISRDSRKSHEMFAKKYGLSYYLIPDKFGRLRKLFRVPRRFFLLSSRITFVIDKSGKIIHIIDDMLDGSRHVEESLEAIRKLG